MKGRSLYPLILLLLVHFSGLKAAIPNGSLMIPVQFIIENGDYINSIVDVKKNGESILNQGGQRNLHLRLQFGNEYLLSFSKPGYITKKIRVNTTVAEEHGKQGFEPYKIGVRLYKQYDGVNTVVYNQPVAYICYQGETDAFGYDVDYTKSILSVLTETENILEERAREERLSQKNVIKSSDLKSDKANEQEPLITENESKTSSRNQNTQQLNSNSRIESVNTNLPGETKSVNTDTLKSGKKHNEGDDAIRHIPPTVGEDTPPLRSGTPGIEKPLGDNYFAEGQDTIHFSNSSNPDDIPVVFVKRKKADNSTSQSLTTNSEEKSLLALKPVNGQEVADIKSFHQTGNDLFSKKAIKDEIQNRTIEKRIEANRIITSIIISNGTHITEYSRINYNWGGVFFFVNKTIPISEHLFNYFTRE